MTSSTLDIISHSSAQTQRLGARLGELLQGGELILLDGQLGTGKTTFTQGLAQGLGITQVVNSPTFTLLKEYPGQPRPGRTRSIDRRSASSATGAPQAMSPSASRSPERAQHPRGQSGGLPREANAPTVRGTVSNVGGEAKSPLNVPTQPNGPQGMGPTLYHFDLYRLDNPEEILDLGFEDYFYGTGVCVVEWADKILRCAQDDIEFWPTEHMHIRMKMLNETKRGLLFTATSVRYSELLRQFQKNSYAATSS